MSWILRDEVQAHFFSSWKENSNKVPTFTDKINRAKYWPDKTNCKRFLKHNQDKGILDCLEPFRIIKVRYCEYCKNELDPEMRGAAKYCSDECRNKTWVEENRE